MLIIFLVANCNLKTLVLYLNLGHDPSAVLVFLQNFLHLYLFFVIIFILSAGSDPSADMCFSTPQLLSRGKD